MSTLEAIPIRLALTTRSSPPVPPLDSNTGETPQFWRGTAVDLEVGIFDPQSNSVDLSNLAFLNLVVFAVPRSWGAWRGCRSLGEFSLLLNSNEPVFPLILESVAQADFDEDVVTWQNWKSQVSAQVTFSFSAIQTSLLRVPNGQPSQTFVMIVQGLTTDGRSIIYAGGPLTVFESGSDGVYMPNTVAPLDVPFGAIFYLAPNTQIPFSLPISAEGTIVSDGGILVQDGGSATPPEMPSNSYHAQSLASGNATVSPTSSNHSEDVMVTAGSGTLTISLSIAAPPTAGDLIFLGLILPAASGVIVQIYNASTGGTELAEVLTDGTEQTANAFLRFVFTGAVWELQLSQIPAHF